MQGTRTLFLVLGVAAGTACATEGRTKPPAAASATPAQSPEVEDLERNLADFGAEVREFADSARHPSSVQDPKSFRGRERAGEQRLSARAATLRERIHQVFGTQPVPIGSPSADKPTAAPERQKKMLDQLDQSERELGEARKKLAD